jgi:hypothetical protein
MEKALITVLAAITLATAHAQNGWATYRNDAAGYSITYPSSLRLMPWKGDPSSSEQWRTKSFQSKDGEVELYVETHSIIPEFKKSLQDEFNDEFTRRTQGGDHINYSVVKNNWYVITGTNAKGYEFYKKYFIFSSDRTDEDGWWIYFDLVYPHSERQFYDPIVAKIAHDFIPKLPGKYDH